MGQRTPAAMLCSTAFLAALALLLFGAAAEVRASPDIGGALPVYRGRVVLFTLTPRGDIDGFILSDWTEVKTPPHMTRVIANAVRLGDVVTVQGLKAAALPLVEAVSITDSGTGETVTDHGPPSPPLGVDGAPPAPVSAQPRRIEGRIRLVLHGARGDVNGVLLEDGTVVRIAAAEAEVFGALLDAGRRIVADGVVHDWPLGSVFEPSAIGGSADRLVPVAAETIRKQTR